MSGQYCTISSTTWNRLEFHSNASSGHRTKLSFIWPSAMQNINRLMLFECYIILANTYPEIKRSTETLSKYPDGIRTGWKLEQINEIPTNVEIATAGLFYEEKHWLKIWGMVEGFNLTNNLPIILFKLGESILVFLRLPLLRKLRVNNKCIFDWFLQNCNSSFLDMPFGMWRSSSWSSLFKIFGADVKLPIL